MTKKDGSKYCGQVIQKIVKSSDRKPLCCVDFIIIYIAENSISHTMELERIYDNARLPGLMFCP
jgi:hypothetical protein